MTDATREWTDQLMDVSGRNQLLFYRDLKVGTLDLGDADPSALDALLRGRKSSITQLFDPVVVPDRLKRARAIRNKSVESLEERGIVTCYLTSGMAAWQAQQGKPTPNAPVLLRAATFTATDAAESDFDLVAEPEVQMNPVLVQLLSSDFKVLLDPDELIELLPEGSFDPSALFERLGKEGSRIPGFAVEPRALVGTFSYAKLPMVADLKANAQALAAHKVVAAIAGDAEARRSLTQSGQEIDLTEPDRRPPSDEFLVLDADSSQSYAINAVTGGQSIVISGPPGTGKSQTIANLVASLVARGSSVLFVAEKRTAIAAVVGRLERVGLSDLVLDLHGGVRSRRVLAESLSAGLRAASGVARPGQRALHERLMQRREQLNAHDAAMHVKRSPWNVSAFEVQTALIDLVERDGPAAETRVRVRGAQLAAIDDSTYRRLLEKVHEFAALGGFRLTRVDSPWADAHIRSSEQAEAAFDTASRLASLTVPKATRALETLIGEAGLTPPRDLAEWTQALALLGRVSELLRVFDPAVFGPELAERVAAAATRDWRKAHSGWPGHDAGWGVRRRRVKSARSLWRGPATPSKQQLHVALQEAHDLDAAWRVAAVDQRGPHAPASMFAAKGLFDQLRLELAALGAYVVGTDFEHLDKAGLQSTIESLQSDAQILFKMPRINELNDEFDRAGLGPLIEEMKGRRLDADLAGAVFQTCWHRSVLERITFEDQALANFQGTRHHELVSTFREADNEHVSQTAQRVRRAAAERLVRVRDEHEEQSTLVQAQAQRKRGHLPLRELFRAAPDVMTALKPCWAMSPLVVSQLLPGDRPYFDVVIFDEASQVLPADAIPAILRGRRLVVAGDAQQLPPTNFFSSASEGNSDEQQAILDDGTINLALTSGYESILDVLTAGLGPGRT